MEQDYFIVRLSKDDELTNQAMAYNSASGTMFAGSLDRAYKFGSQEDAIGVCMALNKIKKSVSNDDSISHNVYEVKVTSHKIH